MATSMIKWDGILLRFVFALLLVFATYNPSGYSYYDWLTGMLPNYSALLVFAGVCLLIGWVIFIRATLRSLGVIGLILASAFFFTLLWLAIDLNWVSPDNVKMITYLVLILLSGVLATGVSWSHIRRRITGQVDVDDVDEA